jgi:hypothetical protein
MEKIQENDLEIVTKKLDNFKKFIKEISEKGNGHLATYEHLALPALIVFANFYLKPNKDKLDDLVVKMQEQLKFEDKHKERVKKYLECFIEYLTVQNETKKSE